MQKPGTPGGQRVVILRYLTVCFAFLLDLAASDDSSLSDSMVQDEGKAQRFQKKESIKVCVCACVCSHLTV